MIISSLEKTLFLKRKLTEAHTLASDNISLREKLTAFDVNFSQLVAQMEAIGADEILSQDEVDREEFLTHLNLNRGDADKRRFTTINFEDQVNFEYERFMELIRKFRASQSQTTNDEDALVTQPILKQSSLKDPKYFRNLTKHACIEDQISRLTKTLVEAIEDENLSPEIVEAYRKHGIYQMLYHNGVMGHYVTHGFLSMYNKKGYPPFAPTLYLAFATISVAFFATVALLGLSGGWAIVATALFSAAVAYMAGVLYGIINDIFATRANLSYFLLGHQNTQYSPLISNDRLVQAIGWGIIGAQPLAVIASVIFAIVTASVMTATALPVLTFILPILLVLVPLFAVFANIFANYTANKYMKEGCSLKFLSEEKREEFRVALNLPAGAESIDLDQIDFDMESVRTLLIKNDVLNSYQLDGLALMSSSKKEKANWLANGERNLLGYIGTPLIAVTGLVLMLTLTSVPVIFFSPLLATIIPVVAATIAIASLAIALTYLTVNKEKQVDNRYKLFTNGQNGEKKIDELYVMDEQLLEVHAL